MARWIVCSEPGCSELHQGSGRCPDCRREHEKERGSSTQRGYGTTHRKTRKQLLATAVGRICPLCDREMLAGQPLDLDHSVALKDDPTSKGDRMVHSSCNRGRRT